MENYSVFLSGIGRLRISKTGYILILLTCEYSVAPQREIKIAEGS